MTGDAVRRLLASRQQLSVEVDLAERLALYLDLLLRWNARTNLSAIRDPESIVLRHFGESLQCARALPAGITTLLDYGSGAGFPGAICALARPEIAVTLAESQSKKAAFLQELNRTLDQSITIFAGRVEQMAPSRVFGAVTLRAVDRMEDACQVARTRLRPGGWLVLVTTQAALGELAPKLAQIAWRAPLPLAGSDQGVVALGRTLADAGGPGPG